MNKIRKDEKVLSKKKKPGIPIQVAIKRARDIGKRKGSREQIEQAARKWTITFDAIKDGIALLAVDQTILKANQAFANLVKKPFPAIIGKKCHELIHSDRLPPPHCPFKKMLKSKKRESRELVLNDHIFEVVVDPITDDAGAIAGAAHIISDITERKRTEQALCESESKYRILFETANDAIFLMDQNIFIDCNTKTLEIFGCTREQIIGQTPYRFSPDLQPDGRNSMEKALEKIHAAISGQPQFFEWQHNRLDGTLFNAEVSLKAVSTAGKYSLQAIVRDITERKKMEDELKDSEIRYHNLFENSSEFIYTLDLKGNFTDVNKAALALTGYTKSELLKMNFKDYTPKRDHRKLFLTLSNIYKTGEPLQNFLVEAVIKDKSKKYFETSISLLKEGEQIIGYQGSSKDITERKHAEEQIHASLLEKEVLLKEIHHRVKNNLQIISGLLTLQAAQINDERLQRVIKESQGRIWTMALIHQTLYQSGNLVDIDMADYIRSLSGNLLSSQARVALPPTVSFDLLPVRLVIDKAIPLALIINELLTNTLKHAFPDGRQGEIRISLQERSSVKFYSTTDNKDAAQPVPERGHATYELTVADDGVGLPADFDAKNQKSLGLQLVTMLTKQLDGTLAIESSGGTSVHIIFNNNEKT